MSRPKPIRVHLIAGGFPPGSPAGHDMDYARMRLLAMLAENETVQATVSNDFEDIAKWLPGSRLLVTYVAGPFPNEQQNAAVREWIEAGGRWLGIHGTSGGKAAQVGANRYVRKMVKGPHHATLGAFFLNHPPVRRFTIEVADRDHPITRDLPAAFDTIDELYMLELQDPDSTHVLLTTSLEKDPSPQGFGFVYDKDTSLMPDGHTRVLGYTHRIGRGEVAYIALGHCHSPASNVQPFVDASVEPSGKTPLTFHGSWDNPNFEKIIRNAIGWGIANA